MIDEDQVMSDGRRGSGPSMRRNHISMASGTTVHLAINAFHAQVERNRTLELGDSSPSASRRLSRGSSSRRSIGRIARLAAISSVTGAEPARAPIGETSELLDDTVDIAHLPPKNSPSRKSGCLPVPSEIIQSMINSAPGTYQLDDGSHDISDLYNFYAHGKRFLFASNSLGFFNETNKFRRKVIYLVTSKRFDQLVLFMILANSIVLAIPDLSHVDIHNNLDPHGSVRNAMALYADRVFTLLFSIECILKIIAMGFFGERGAYLTDPWNWIDFMIVFFGILALVPGFPHASTLFAFRVFRPLRFFNALPGIKKLVASLLRSIPELLTVVVFLFVLFFLYGVVGVQFWGGELHSRCRLTPFPLLLDADLSYDELPDYQSLVVSNYTAYRCSDSNEEPIALDGASWTHDTSPWNTARICFWPVAPEDNPQACNLAGDSYRICPAGQTCGSDYDRYGNFRFTHPNATIVRKVLHASWYMTSLNYGLMNFDQIGLAAMILFLCLPRNGWSDTMYMLQDAGYGYLSVLYFVSFLVVSSYFVLNLALAVIWENFSESSLMEAETSTANHASATRLNMAPAAKLTITAKSRPRTRTAIRKLVLAIVEHWAFNFMGTMLVLINTVILSLDKYPVDTELVKVVDLINFALTIGYFMETTLKIIGLGQSVWAEDRYNLFDALVVVLSIADVGINPPPFFYRSDQMNLYSDSFTFFRSVRILTLLKLARSWPPLQKLLETMVKTINEIGNFGVLFMLFMYIYALIGMQMFGNRLRFDGDGFPVDLSQEAAYIPRSNFDTILWAMVTIFQILTGDNWNNVMMDGWRTTGGKSLLFFLSLVIIGNFIVLNLLIAILLANFEEHDVVDVAMSEQKEELRRKSRIPELELISSVTSFKRSRGKTFFFQSSSRVLPAALKPSRSKMSLKDRSASSFDPSAIVKPKPKMKGHSLFLFGPKNPIRTNTTSIVNHPHFDAVVLVLIVASTLSVALDNPLTAPDSSIVTILRWVDIILTSLFLLEVVLKVITHGLFFAPDAYLKDNWNVMDFVITAVAVPGLLGGTSKIKFLKTLRTFRALRPLRLINRNPGLKLVVSSLFASVPQIVNVLLVCFLLFISFSIVAVNNLKGKFLACMGSNFDALSSQQQDLLTYPRIWTNLTADEQTWFNESVAAAYAALESTAPTSRVLCDYFNGTWDKTVPQTFDNVLIGCRTFYEMSSLEGWTVIMVASVDATEIDMQPIPNHQLGWTIFHILFMVTGSFFVIQLFIGVVVENFGKMKEKLDGTFLLSGSQREWLMISEAMLNLRPLRKQKIPHGWLRRICFRMAKSPGLENVTTGCIVLNTFMMALTYFQEEDSFTSMVEYCNYAFAAFFTAEAAIKITGLGRYYWKEPWNIFDFTIVVGSFFGMVYTWIGGSSARASAATIRSVRVTRLVKLIQTAPSLRQLVNTLIITLPSLVNIGGILSLVFFIYAALGVQLFAKVQLGDLVTKTANFQSIGRAMTTLFRCATGESWQDIMHDLASAQDCTPDPSYDAAVCGFHNFDGCIPINGCGSTAAYYYLSSFTLLVSFVLFNIFIAIVLEGFANEKDRANGVLLRQHYDNFVVTWAIFDPEATGYIEWHLLERLLQQLDAPLGFGMDYIASAKEMSAYIEFLDFAIYNNNRVFFSDVARKLGKFVLDVVNEAPVADLPPTIEIDQKWRTLLKGSKIRKTERSTHRLNHITAAVLLQNAVKSLIFRDELKVRVQKFTELTDAYLATSVEGASRAQRQPDDDGSDDDDESFF